MKQVKTKCDCYCEKEEPFYPTNYQQGWYAGKGEKIPKTIIHSYCSGTKECEQCKCGGDINKCDFYKEEFKKAKLKKAIINVEVEQ